MQKEEFPTFLNEQPKVIFGRTGRELLIMVCGIVMGYSLWGDINPLFHNAGWSILCLVIASVPALLSVVVALVTIGNRPLEEWLFAWLLYMIIPRLYLYQPVEEEMEALETSEQAVDLQQLEDDEAVQDTLEEE